MTRSIAYHFKKVVQKATEFLMSIDLGDFVRLLSVTVTELAGVTGIRQVDQPSAEFFEAEFGGKMNERRKFEIRIH